MILLWSLLFSNSPQTPQRFCLSLGRPSLRGWSPMSGHKFQDGDFVLHILHWGWLLFSLDFQDLPAPNSPFPSFLYTSTWLFLKRWSSSLLSPMAGDDHTWTLVCQSPLFSTTFLPDSLILPGSTVLQTGELLCVNSWHNQLPIGVTVSVRQLYRSIMTYLVRSPRPSHGSRNLYI